MIYLIKNGKLRTETNPVRIESLKQAGWEVTVPPIVADIEDREVTWGNEGWEIRYRTIDYPPAISARQMRLWLSQNGLLGAVKAAIAGKQGNSGKIAEIEFEYATQFARQHPLVIEIGAQLNLTDDMLDQLFLEAAQL